MLETAAALSEYGDLNGGWLVVFGLLGVIRYFLQEPYRTCNSRRHRRPREFEKEAAFRNQDIKAQKPTCIDEYNEIQRV